MTVGELRDLLLTLDPTQRLEVIARRFSDYEEMALEDVSVVEAVKKSSACYVMRSHRDMSPEDRAAVRPFVYFDA